MYDAALRAELTPRLGLQWEPVVQGHADIVGIPETVRELFSQRSAQVEASLAEYVRRWVDEHDGADSDARTIARLQRLAVLDSRPAKVHGQEADSPCTASGPSAPSPPASTRRHRRHPSAADAR